MKVLHVVTLHTPTNAFGGPLRVALNLAAGLRDRGVDARMLALADGFGPQLPTTIESVPAQLFRARHVLPRFEVSGITSPSLLARMSGLVRWADVVHVHLMRDLITLPVAVAAQLAGRPLVLQTHGMVDPSDKPLARGLDRLAVRRLLRRADRVLHLTPLEAEELQAVVGAPLANLTRLVNGVQPADRRPSPTGPPVVVYLARMQTRKRPVDFVRAAPAVLARHPDARFVLAGPDSGALPEALAAARELGIAHAVDDVGPLSHPRALAQLRAASVYVLPSVEEPFPMSVLEALSVGVPAVVTDTNGLAGDIAAAGAGRVVTTADGLAPAIVELLDPVENAAASAAAWRLSRATFSIGSVLDTLQDVYGASTALPRGRLGVSPGASSS